MTRNKIVSIFLAAVIILAIVAAPLAVVEASQSGILARAVQGGSKSFSIGVTAPAVPAILACDGFSCGGTGPG